MSLLQKEQKGRTSLALERPFTILHCVSDYWEQNIFIMYGTCPIISHRLYIFISFMKTIYLFQGVFFRKLCSVNLTLL